MTYKVKFFMVYLAAISTLISITYFSTKLYYQNDFLYSHLNKLKEYSEKKSLHIDELIKTYENIAISFFKENNIEEHINRITHTKTNLDLIWEEFFTTLLTKTKIVEGISVTTSSGFFFKGNFQWVLPNEIILYQKQSFFLSILETKKNVFILKFQKKLKNKNVDSISLFFHMPDFFYNLSKFNHQTATVIHPSKNKKNNYVSNQHSLSPHIISKIISQRNLNSELLHNEELDYYYITFKSKQFSYSVTDIIPRKILLKKQETIYKSILFILSIIFLILIFVAIRHCKFLLVLIKKIDSLSPINEPSNLKTSINQLDSYINNLKEINIKTNQNNHFLEKEITSNKEKEFVILNMIEDIKKERSLIKQEIILRTQTEKKLKISIQETLQANENLNSALETKDIAERRVRALLDSSRNLIGLMSTDGTLLDANMTSLQTSGVQYNDVIGKLFWDTAWWTHSQDMQDRLKKSVKKASSGQKDQFLANHLAPDGSLIHVDFTLTPIFSNHNKVTGLIPEGVNITDSIIKEKKLKEANEELSRSNTNLDDFAYVASHDLKSPLRAIDHLAKWIYEDSGELLSKKSRQDLISLQERTKKMQNLLDGLLAYSKAGRPDQDIKEANPKFIVNEISELLEKPLHFKISYQGYSPIFHTKITPFTVVMRNLISNSIKHRESDLGTVIVTCKEIEKFYAFSVSDDGPGIPEKQHEKIFGLFKTLKQGSDIEANGLGLAIVKKTVESQGGEIYILPHKHKQGVTFEFTWPKSL